MDTGVHWPLEAAPILVLVVQLCGTVDSRAMSGIIGVESCGLRQNPLLRDGRSYAEERQTMTLYRCKSCDPHVFAVTLSVQGAVVKVWCGSCRREARDLEAIQRYFEPL